jgi:hypothetical protein
MHRIEMLDTNEMEVQIKMCFYAQSSLDAAKSSMVTNPFGYYQCAESMVIFGNGNIVVEVRVNMIL